jgi:CII-binding regulator of phage lambda lysogenization HflD
MNDQDHILTFDTFDDIDLYELTETARNSNYKKLAEWMYQYKKKQISEHNKRYEDQKKKEYEHEFHVLLGLIDSFIKRTIPRNGMSFRNLRETWKIKKRIRFIAIEIFSQIEIDDTSWNRLCAYLKQKKYTDEFKAFLVSLFKGESETLLADPEASGEQDDKKSTSTIDNKLNEFIEKMFKGKDRIENSIAYIEPEEFLAAYDSKLKDHIYLLEDLIDILNIEYDRRVISTKVRFEEYLLPRKRVLEKIDEEIEEISDDIKFLGDDENVGEEDREKLRNAFSRKQGELEDIKRIELEKLASIKMVSTNIKDGVWLFKDLIDNLRKKLRYFKKRQFYVERLARYGAEIPKLKNVLDVLYSTFNTEIKKLQKSFLLFDISFQKTIFTAIDDQSIINRIILSPKGIVDAELAIEDSAPLKSSAAVSDFSEREKVIVGRIEDDLSFLTPYEEKKADKKS